VASNGLVAVAHRRASGYHPGTTSTRDGAMHKSRLAGFIIDCEGKDLDGAVRFWSAALGLAPAGREGARYEKLDASA
jgi:hypothetical protein